MIDLSDLGLRPDPIAEPVPAEPERRSPLALTPGSPLARALFEVWQGRPVTVLKAAPGSGKSTLITRLVALLLSRTELSVAILTPTRSAAFDLAERVGQELAESCGPRSRFACVLGLSQAHQLPTVHSIPGGAFGVGRVVTVRTVASASGFSNPVQADVTIIDEAYQVTLSDMAVALRDSGQMVLVGDPGQIGPVVTIDDSVWERRPDSPTRRAPELMLERPDAAVIELSTTYRLGPVTTDLINRLYDFPIGCGRSPRHVTSDPRLDPVQLRSPGGSLPEIVRLVVPDVVDRNDADYLHRIAETARSYVGRTVHITTPDGQEVDYTLEAGDICVVAAYRTQVARLAAALDSYALGSFRVGTADSLQGGQWHVVVAVDPLLAAETAEGHNASLGRLCVMLSRHMTHLVWVCDDRWRAVLKATPPGEPTLPTSRAVRQHLDRAPVVGVGSQRGIPEPAGRVVCASPRDLTTA